MKLASIAIATLSLSAAQARADSATHEIKSTDAKVAVGAKGTASVTIEAKNGWHVNEEAPISLTLTPDPGVTLPKAKLVRDDLAVKGKDAPRFDVAFSAAEAGKKTIAAEARFVMCQETACKPEKVKLALAVEVTAAAPAEAGKADAPKAAKKK